MPELLPARKQRISATTLDRDALSVIINRLVGTKGSADTVGGRFRALHEKIRHRTEHFHNLEAADPILPSPYDGGAKYQSDILRRTHVQLKARQTENVPVVRVAPPRESPSQQKLADNYEMVRNRIFDLVQERQGNDIVGALFDGINIYCYGVLHWVMAPDVWPAMDDPDAIDELPQGTEAERYNTEPDENGRYKETDASVQDRAKHAKAMAGAPWYIEVIPPDACGFVIDRSQAQGFGMFVVTRRVPILDYSEKLRAKDGIYLSLNATDKSIRIYEEATRPSNYTPSGGDAASWGRDVTVAEVWTRDEYYELVSDSQTSQYELVKAFRHPYRMPPFALAYGNRHNSPDPALAYEPLMEGLYRIKPFYDRDMALAKVIAEMIALPYYYIELSDGAIMLDATGKPLMLTRNALSAQALPAGAKLAKVEYEINPAFVKFLENTAEELKQAAPSTGQAEVSATTQAWAIRLQQAQASIEVAASLRSVATCLRTMHRNQAYVESLSADEGGFGEPIWVYGKSLDGKVDRSTAIGIEPKDIPTLELDVEIAAHSAAERITMEQHGMEMLLQSAQAGVRVLTRREFLEDYRGVEDASSAEQELDAEELWITKIKPVVVEQELAKRFAQFVVMGADGNFAGPGGQQVSPAEVLSMNGQPPPPQPMGPPGVNGIGQNPALQPQMPGLPQLQAPGAMPVPGMQG